MKKLFLILGVMALIVACTPKTQQAVETPAEDEMAVVDEVVADQPATPAKPAVKPTTPKEEPKVEEPVKEEPKAEEPKPDEPKTNVVKGRR
jgi:outer membrane biosynthesis protein TonB